MSYSRPIFLCNLLILFFFSSSAQDPLSEAQDLYKAKNYKDCTQAVESVLSDKSIYPDSTIAAAYKLRGDLYLKESDIVNTLAMYELADKIYVKYGNDFFHERIVLANKSGICYAQQDNLVQTAKYFQKEYDIAIQNYEPDDLTVGKSTNNLATVYLYIGDYEQSLDYFFKSVEIKKKFVDESPIPLANTYENISTIYGQINQMGQAEKYLQKAGLLYQQDSAASIEALFPYYMNLGAFYIENEQVERGLEQLDKAEALPLDFKTSKLGEIIHKKLYGDAYFQNKNYDKSLAYYQEAELLIKKYNVGQKELGVIHTQMAYIFAQKGNNTKALTSLKNGDKEMLALYGSQHKNYLNLLQKQVFILLKMGETKEANNLINKYKTNFKLRNESSNKDLLFSNLKMGLLTMDLNYRLTLYKQNKQSDDLDSAISIAKIVIDYQDEVLDNISDKENRLYFFQHAYSNFSSAIFLYVEKYNATSNVQFLEKAFLLSERAKYYSLQEQKGVQPFEYNESISSELVKEAKSLKLQLNQATSIYETKLDQESDPNAMLQLINSIDSLKSLHSSIVDKLVAESPNLKQQLSSNSDFNFNDVKAQLAKRDKTYISYFLNDNELIERNYAFVIHEGEMAVSPIDVRLDELKVIISSLLSQLRLDLQLTNSEEKLTAYKKPASELFELLLAPLDLKSNSDLLISAHQELLGIPFEVLLDPANNEYLVQKHPISYVYALRLLQESTSIPYSKELLVSAPTFEEKHDLGFSSLQNSQEEIEIVESILNITPDNAQSKEAFQAYVSSDSYNVIHLATHASANQQKGYQSYLAFGNRAQDLLYSREIYGLPVRANLVVLSACETGDGELIKSQGLLGLNSAFTATSTQSLVTSLWNINDAASQEIMQRFYTELKNGKPKDQALRSAKLDYLSSVPKSKQHPFYWAGYTLYGNSDSLQFSEAQNFKWIGAMIICCSILIIFFWVRTKNKAAPNN